MKTEELITTSGETVEYARMYAAQQADYVRLEVAKRLSKTTSTLVTVAVISFLVFMVIIFMSAAAGLWLGQLWGSYALAFLCLTGIYAFAAAVIYFFKNSIITRPIISLMIKNLLD